MLEMGGYALIRQDRVSRKKSRGGGLVIYAKNSKTIKHLPDSCLCNDDIELVILQTSLKCVREIYILFVYRPPDGNVSNFIQHCEDVMLNLTEKLVFEINIVGDININPTKRDLNVKRYKDFIHRHGHMNLINGDTYHHHNGTSSPVDHFLTNNQELYQTSGISLYPKVIMTLSF